MGVGSGGARGALDTPNRVIRGAQILFGPPNIFINVRLQALNSTIRNIRAISNIKIISRVQFCQTHPTSQPQVAHPADYQTVMHCHRRRVARQRL